MVVIFTVGVGCDFGRIRIDLFFRSEIIERQADKRLCTRHEQRRVYAQVEMVFHVGHASVCIAGEPFFQVSGFLVEPFSACKTDELETQSLGFIADDFGVAFGGLHGAKLAK